MVISCLRMYNFFMHCFIIALVLIGHTAPVQSQDSKKVDSLKRKLVYSIQNEERFTILNELFKEYNQVDYKVALSYASEFNILAKQVGDSVKIVEGGRKIAYSLMDLGKNDEAITNLIEVLGIAERNKGKYPEIKKQIKFILNNAGIAYNHLGNYDKALEYHFKSLLIREEEGDKKSIGTALNNLGNVFYNLKDHKKAIDYYQRALNTKKDIGDVVDLDRILINLGLCYNQIGEFKNGISQFDQGFAICGLNCSDNVKREGLLGLGIAYSKSKNLDKAEECFLKSLTISKKQNNALYQINNLFQLSLVESIRGNDEKELKYLDEALVLAEGSDYVDPLIQVYEQFAKLYGEKSDYKKTAFYLSKYKQLKDSIYSDELIKNLAKVQTNYAERENIKTIKEKDEVLVLKEALIARQRAQNLFVAIIVLLVLGLGLVLLIANKRQQRVSADLAMAKVQIEEQNSMLSVQNKELDKRVKERTVELSKSNKMLMEVNSELDNFLYKTSHDIRGPLVTLKGLCNLALIEAKDSAALRDILDKLDGQSDKMARILSRLTAVGKVNQSNLAPIKIDFKHILDTIIASEEVHIQTNNIKVTYHIEGNVTMISDWELVTSVLENTIDNGIKFYNSSSRVSPFVHISVNKEADQIVVKVEDNGIGILNSKVDEVFHMFMRASEICVDKLGGEIKLENSTKDGSTFVIHFPLDLNDILEKRKGQHDELVKQLEKAEESEKKSRFPFLI
jgi:signal transduction histidine kinase